jgi:hypothetical protein
MLPGLVVILLSQPVHWAGAEGVRLFFPKRWLAQVWLLGTKGFHTPRACRFLLCFPFHLEWHRYFHSHPREELFSLRAYNSPRPHSFIGDLIVSRGLRLRLGPLDSGPRLCPDFYHSRQHEVALDG